MPSNEINQYKRDPPKELLGTYENAVLKKPGPAAQNVVIAEQVWDPANMQVSTAGMLLLGAPGILLDSMGRIFCRHIVPSWMYFNGVLMVVVHICSNIVL